MRSVSRSALVPYSAEQMYLLVDDIEKYPQFLPWCHSAIVHSREPNVVEATLELRRGGLSKSFTTRNTLRPGEAIELELLGGPFRKLGGAWTFKPLGQGGCKVALDLEFEFDSRVTDMILGPFFEDICNSLVDAFTRRASDTYGPGGK